MVLVDLALGWGRVGLFGFGGGPSMVPLMRVECVDVRGWLTDAQFLDALAIGNALPGPIAMKMAAHVGRQVAGPAGAVVAFLAVSAPSALLMVALFAVMNRFREHPRVEGAMAAIKPAAVGMLAWTAIELAPDGVRSWRGAALAVAAMVALALKVHPVLVVVAAMGVGATALR